MLLPTRTKVGMVITHHHASRGSICHRWYRPLFSCWRCRLCWCLFGSFFFLRFSCPTARPILYPDFRLSCAACLSQQKFHKITQAYYRGSHGIVLVYDISDPETLDNTAYWMKSIRDTAGSNRVQICLVGNKVCFPRLGPLNNSAST